MKTFELAKELEGISSIKMMQINLNISRAKAIYLIHKLRKKGFVRTKYNSDKTRVYYISPLNVANAATYLDIINKYAPLGAKLRGFDEPLFYGKVLRIEEALIYAIKKNSIRYIIASLALFRKISDWSLLYKLAKKDNLVREVAALYEVARRVVRKVRKMPERFKNLTKPKNTDSYKYIIEKFDSQDFKDIENKWKVYIPLNSSDLEEYRI